MSNGVAVRENALDVMVIVRDLMQRPDFSIDMLKELLALREKEELRQAEREFQIAFARCQSHVTVAKRDKENPLFHSRYATIEKMYEAVWPHVTSEGFDWVVTALPIAPPGWDNTVIWFRGTLSRDIASRTVELPLSRDALRPEGSKGNRAAQTSMQATGAATTYMRKYLLGIMFNVITADDVKLDTDGNRNSRFNGAGKPHDPLDEPDPRIWVRNLTKLVRGAQSREEVNELDVDPRVVDVYRSKANQDLKDYIDDLFREAHQRFPEKKTNGGPPDDWVDPIAEQLADVAAIDDVAKLDALTADAEWSAKARIAATFPPDEDRLKKAIDDKREALQQGSP